MSDQSGSAQSTQSRSRSSASGENVPTGHARGSGGAPSGQERAPSAVYTQVLVPASRSTHVEDRSGGNNRTGNDNSAPAGSASKRTSGRNSGNNRSRGGGRGRGTGRGNGVESTRTTPAEDASVDNRQSHDADSNNRLRPGRRRGNGSGRGSGSRGDNTASATQAPPDSSPPPNEAHSTAEPHQRRHQHQQQHDRSSGSGRGRGSSRRGKGKSVAAEGQRGRSNAGNKDRIRGAAQGKRTAGAHNVDDEDDDQPLCVVCAEDLEFFAVGDCNHPGRCATCAMRSRVLLKDRSCPECKTVLDRLVVAELPANGEAPRFESFNLWGDFAGPNSQFDDESGMVFHSCSKHYDHLLRTRNLYCPVGGCRGIGGGKENRGGGEKEIFPSKGSLLDHMKNSHQRFLCDLCVENRPLFVAEQEVFTSTALRKHEGKIEGGHPLCRFCSKRFFDNTALYDHMTGTHINCHICPEENQHRYFRGEPQLRDHLRTSHFLCDRGECRQRGMVSAFNTQQEFQAHLLEDHGIADRRAAVGFSVRRAGRDGVGLNTNGDSSNFDGGVPAAGAPAIPGESFAAPDPDFDLAGGIVVSVPSSRGRNSRQPQRSSAGNGNPLAGGFGNSGGGGASGRGGWAGVAGDAGRASPIQEAFPSLPAARPGQPRATQERHAFSLVGRGAGARSERGIGAATGVAGARAGVATLSERGVGGRGGGGGGGGGGAGFQEDETPKSLLMRNKRLADALGIRAALGAGAAIGGAKVGTTAGGTAVAMGIGDGLDGIREHLARTNYSTYLVSWARANRTELSKLEKRFAELVVDRKGTSTQLKPMPSEHRKAVHELAAQYGLVTQSFDLEPKRYVSAIKQKGCRIPHRLLSAAARDPGYQGTDEEVVSSAPVVEQTVTNSRAIAMQQSGATLSTTAAAVEAAAAASLAARTAGALGGGGGGGGLSAVDDLPTTAAPPSARTATVISISSAVPASAPSSPRAGVDAARARSVSPPPPSVPPAAAAAGAGASQPSGRMSAQQRKKWRNDLQSQQHGVGASSGTAVASATVPEDDVASGSSPHPNDHEQQAGRHGVANHASTASKKETLNDTNPGSLLVFHSMQTGLSGEAVLAAVKALVPARTVVGFRSATQVEASASGVGAVRGGSSFQGGPLVVEFTNKLNARRAWEKIEKEAEQLLAAARVTRADYHAPFRARLYPSPPSAVMPSLSGTALGGIAVAGDDDDLEIRDNWDDSSEDDDEGKDEGKDEDKDEDKDKEEKGDENADKDEDRDGGEKTEETVDTIGVAAREDELAVQESASSSREPLDEGGVADTSDRAENGRDQIPTEDGVAPFPKPPPGLVRSAISPPLPDMSEGDVIITTGVIRAEDSPAASPKALPPAAAAVPPITGGNKRQSKWGQSALKGRLSRPSDGRATTVELDAKERQERLEKLRRLEEERRENRQKRDQAKRVDRADVGKLDAHAFMWETLGGDSSSESASEDEIDVEASSTEIKRPVHTDIGENNHVRGGVPHVLHESTNDAGKAGWSCENCTYFNELGMNEKDSSSGDLPRCEMCEAEGPRNAALPWLTS